MINSVQHTKVQPPSVIVEPSGRHLASVCWLHGLGASAEDFYSLLPYLNFLGKENIRWIFPNAPRQAVTINQGMVMPSWFDIRHLEVVKSVDEKQLQDSSDSTMNLLSVERQRLIDHGKEPKICIAGFSQGGVVALNIAKQWSYPLHILAMSCCFPNLQSHLSKNVSKNSQLDFTVMHGESDLVIPLKDGYAVYQDLKKLNAKVQWFQYSMAHEVCQKQIQDISKFFDCFVQSSL